MQKTYIIAEMACSHDGNSELAKKIIDGAGKAGADAIQFQIWSARDLLPPYHDQFEAHLDLEMPREDWAALAQYAREQHGLDVVACVYEAGSLQFAREIGADALKIHTSDLSNKPFLRLAAATKLRTDLSIGASTLDEIQNALTIIREVHPSEIWLMYGIQNFPTPPEAIRLEYMMSLGRMFGLKVGYQDHSAGGSDEAFWLPAAALGMGVHTLEKHITHDRAKKGYDHQAALNPDEFADFVRMVRVLDQAKGTGEPQPFSPDEVKYRRYSKKRVLAARDLPKGHAITENDLLFMRLDGDTITPEQAQEIDGKIVTRDVKKYEAITSDLLG